MTTLRYCLHTAYDSGEKRHAQVVMSELGITYADSEGRSLGDDWLFFECANIPAKLPPFLAVSDCQSSQSIDDEGMRRVAETPPPDGQKFAPGARVQVEYWNGQILGATVEYTYAHAYGGNCVDQYALNVDGFGSCAWFDESELTLLT